jgi:iron complex outermembrane receptor protein
MLAKRILLSSAVIGLMLPVLPAAAQQAAPSAAPESAGQMEEITVTARKRDESLLKTPVFETVLSQQKVEQFGIVNLATLKSQVPGLLLGQSVNEVGTQLTLRGIGTTVMNATTDQSVTLNLDGMPLSQGTAYQAGMFDVGQVEVLKGPQALFYGKNSPAGVISLRTADPTDETEIIARAGYETESADRMVEGIVSGQVAPDLDMRLAAHYSFADGYFRNVAQAIPGLGGQTPQFRNLAPSQDIIVRGTAVWTPSSNYNARLKVNYTNDYTDGTGGALEATYCPDGTGGLPPVGIPFLQGSKCKISRDFATVWYDPKEFPDITHGGVPFVSSVQAFSTLEQNLVISPGLTLTSVTGYYDEWYKTLFNADTGAAAITVGEDNSFTNRQFTQELRLTSDYNGPVNFMLGLFYQNAKEYNRVFIPANVGLGLPPELNAVKHYVEIQSYSGFGQVTYDPIPEIEIAAGARWTDEQRQHQEYNFDTAFGGVLGRVPLSPANAKLSEFNVSPEASITYKPTDTDTVYATYKQGFKAGSFDAINFAPDSEPQSYGDERVNGFEVGYKTVKADGNLALNIAAYSYKYNNLQVGANILSHPPGQPAVFQSITINAASADVQGIDLDATYTVPSITGLTLKATTNYNDAHYSKFDTAPCGNAQTIAEGCNQLLNPSTGQYGAQDLSGRGLVRAPLWASTFGADYNTTVWNDKTLVLGANMNYTDSYQTALPDLPHFRQPGFEKYDANITLIGANDGWEASVIGTNITNKLTMAWCANSNARNGTILGGQQSGFPTAIPPGSSQVDHDQNFCSLDPPRAVWFKLTLHPDVLLNE